MFSYLRQNTELKLFLQADDYLKIKWWDDDSYGVHEDCRGQTGGLMSMGKGSIVWKSIKQKLNNNRSTEYELLKFMISCNKFYGVSTF